MVAVAEIAPRANDTNILRRAAEDQIVITNDKDFGELVFRSGQAHQGILLFRLRDGSDANYLRVLAAVLRQYSEHLPKQFVRVREDTVRIQGKVVLLLAEDQEPE